MTASGEVLQNKNWSDFYQHFSCLSAMLAIVSSGLHYGWPSPSLPKLLNPDSSIPITENDGFWLATMPLFGALLGSLTAPLLVDNVGRQKTILLTSGPYLTSWILILVSTSVPVLIIGRFVAGISDGWGFSAVPMYTGEISDPKIRGMFGSWTAVAFISGILIVNIIGSYLSIAKTAAICSIVPIVLVLSFAWMPESPYYYMKKGNMEGAKRSLQKFRGPMKAETELTRIEKAVKEDLTNTRSNPLHLFTVKRNRRAVLVMILCRGTQQLSGNSAIAFYAQNIFEEAGTPVSAELASILFFLTQLIVTIVASNLVDRAGRRPLLMLSIAGSGVTLLVEGIYFYIKTCTTLNISGLGLVPLVALIGYVIFFSFGLQSIPIIILSEVFNQDIKAVAVGFADIYFALLAVITSKYFQITRDNFGMYVPFVSFAIACAVALGITAVSFPETKGKTLEEIQEYFKGSDRKNPDDDNNSS